MAEYAIGIDDHGGWAIYVCVALLPEPVVLQKGRFELTDGSCATQPYHHDSLDVSLVDGEALVADTTRIAGECAELGLGHVLDEVDGECAAVAIRVPPLDAWPQSLEAVQAHYPTLCRADGQLYHTAVTAAARAAGLPVVNFDRKTVVTDAARRMSLDNGELESRLRESAQVFGPPWRKDQQLAAAGGVLALTEGSV